jgi:hypothetical protein
METWLPVPRWEEYYEVSDQGRIRSVARIVDHGSFGSVRRLRQKVLYPGRDGKYLCVGLSGGGRKQTTRVHRLVCEAFSGPQPSPSHEVAHLNGDPHDNRAANLQWATRLENMAHAKAHGTIRKGAGHSRAKISEAQAVAVKRLKRRGLRQRDVCYALGLPHTTVGPIWRGENWKHVPA